MWHQRVFSARALIRVGSSSLGRLLPILCVRHTPSFIVRARRGRESSLDLEWVPLDGRPTARLRLLYPLCARCNDPRELSAWGSCFHYMNESSSEFNGQRMCWARVLNGGR